MMFVISKDHSASQDTFYHTTANVSDFENVYLERRHTPCCVTSQQQSLTEASNSLLAELQLSCKTFYLF